MAQLFGCSFSKQDILAYTGNLAQVGGMRAVELAAGRERGVRAFEVATGTGFEFTVLADRALDITRATFRGKSLAYLSPAGQVHPSYYEPQGAGWVRTFPGGMVTTCGLTYLGAPDVDQGEALGLHGRIANLPAEELGYWTEWVDDECWMHITGTVTEGVIFKSPLRLTRHLSAKLGGNSVRIEDTVENLGGEPSPMMILYHCNFGFPLLSPTARLVLNSKSPIPRDADAAAGMAEYDQFSAPIPGFREQVFYHELQADNDGNAHVALINPVLDGGLGIYLTYHQKTLPNFTQWKMMGHGHYVLGLEPGNCRVEGRSKERAAGTLRVIQPGEHWQYRLEIGVLDGMPAIEEFTRMLKLGNA